MTYSLEGEKVVLKSRTQEICTSGSVRGLVVDFRKGLAPRPTRRERQKLKLAVALAMMCGCAMALVVGYHVDPIKASWSVHTDTIPPNNGVSQTVRCCWDSLSYVELFCGDRGAGGAYNVEVRDVATNDLLARKLNVTPGQGHSWLRFEPMEILGPFTKGKDLTIIFTRAGDSIQYYYQEGDPYKYGFLSATSPHAGQDLAMRCYWHPTVGGQATAV